MKLLTKEIARKMPALYEKDGDHTAPIQVRYFTGSWTWMATEANVIHPDGTETPLCVSLDDLPRIEAGELDVLFFGVVDGFEREAGYFTLNELRKVRNPITGTRIERDLYPTPQTIGDLLPFLKEDQP